MADNPHTLQRDAPDARHGDEGRLYRTLNGMLEGCQLIGFDWRYLYVNDSVVKQSRRTREELLGHTMMEIYPGIEDTALFTVMSRCMHVRIATRMHNRFDYGDGSPGWFDISIQPVPEGIFILSIDVTESMRTEEALREAESRFRLTVESAPHGVLLADDSGRITLVNRELEQMFGYSRQELLGKDIEILLPEGTRTRHAGNRREFLRAPEARGMGVGRDLSGRHRSGGTFPVEVGLSPVHTQDGTLVLATVVDISERRRAEEALRESESRFRLLTESLPQLVWTCDTGGNCDFLSRQWLEYTGIAADVRPATWMTQVHPDDHAGLASAWKNAVDTGRDFRAELRLRRHDGLYRWFDTRAVRIAGADGRTPKWLGSSTDIDDRKRSEDSQLRTQKMEALGTLAGGIAHDFNNILHAIVGNTQLAMMDLPAGHPVQQSLAEIDKAAQRATDLVRRILAFCHQQDAKKETLALQDVADEVIKLLRSTLPARIEINTRFAQDAPGVSADSTQIYQIVMNLATNAAHAIGDGPGTIDIGIDSVDVDEDLARSLPGCSPGRHTRLTVADSGCGMNGQTLQRIFDPFFTTKPAGQGTGLGLSIVDGIMKNHGGAVAVHSQPGQGSVFRLYFPAAAADAHQASARTPSRMLLSGGEHVLYVDDEDALVLLVSRTLERMGYKVTGCTDPDAALARMRSPAHGIDVVVTDLSMPGMSGFDLARELLAMQPDLPIILTSGYVRPEDRQAALSMGIRAMVTKPNTVEELGLLLNRLFRGETDGDHAAPRH